MLLDLERFVTAVCHGRCHIVSDGSFDHSFGTLAIVMYVDNEYLILNKIIPGASTDHSAYCSELGSVYASFHLLDAICVYWDIGCVPVLFGCNGREALNWTAQKEYVAWNAAQQNFVSANQQQLSVLQHQMLIIATHAKGH